MERFLPKPVGGLYCRVLSCDAVLRLSDSAVHVCASAGSLANAGVRLVGFYHCAVAACCEKRIGLFCIKVSACSESNRLPGRFIQYDACMRLASSATPRGIQ